MNIFKILYKQSPMDFYTYTSDNETIIRSTNNTKGYKFDTHFDEENISKIWEEIKLHKRTSTIIIFLLFLTLLYGILFPNYNLFVNNYWYINTLIILVIMFIFYQAITFICTKLFEKKLEKLFGKYEIVKFQTSDIIDEKYYKLFKSELLKSLILIFIIVLGCALISPFEVTKDMIVNKKYKDAINFTTIGSKIFPIAQEWYSLRGYAKFQIGEYQDAIKDYDKAYKLGADGFNIMNFDNKIYIKYHLGEYKSAIEDFNKEIAHADSGYEKDSFLWDKAQFLYNIKHYEEALLIYTDLIERAENDRVFLLKDRLYLERAEVYKQLNMKDLAQQDLINSGSWTQSEDPQNPIPQPVLLINEI